MGKWWNFKTLEKFKTISKKKKVTLFDNEQLGWELTSQQQKLSQNKIGRYLKNCWPIIWYQVKLSFKKIKGFRGGPAIRNPSANTGDTASVPLEGSHMMQSSEAHAPQIWSLHSTACEPQLLTSSHQSPCSAWEKLPQWEADAPQPRVAPTLQLEKARMPQQRPSTAISKNKQVHLKKKDIFTQGLREFSIHKLWKNSMKIGIGNMNQWERIQEANNLQWTGWI